MNKETIQIGGKCWDHVEREKTHDIYHKPLRQREKKGNDVSHFKSYHYLRG
jgi:hypothetical protein